MKLKVIDRSSISDFYILKKRYNCKVICAFMKYYCVVLIVIFVIYYC